MNDGVPVADDRSSSAALASSPLTSGTRLRLVLGLIFHTRSARNNLQSASPVAGGSSRDILLLELVALLGKCGKKNTPAFINEKEQIGSAMKQ